MEVLPIKFLRTEDAPVYGGLNITLAKLEKADLPVAKGIVVTAPNLKLQTVLEHFNFDSKEVFEQSLTLVRAEIAKTPIPEVLEKETKGFKKYWINGVTNKSLKQLWLHLLTIWIEEIKARLWKEGFHKGLSENLEPQLIFSVNSVRSFGLAHFDETSAEVLVKIENGQLEPAELQKIDSLVTSANKKLLIPHIYQWIVDDKKIYLTKVSTYTPKDIPVNQNPIISIQPTFPVQKSAVKVFFDISLNSNLADFMDGFYINSEKIFDLNKPNDSFENLTIKLINTGSRFPDLPIILKLADHSEGMGKLRGTLRLLHQDNLLSPLIESVLFVRHKKGLHNLHLAIPFVRTKEEFLRIKRELAAKGLMRKHSLQHWLELAVPENLLNLEEYLLAGVDGVIFNLDELIGHLGGFDQNQPELTFYKNDVSGLLKFIEDGIRTLHKTKVPFIASGSLNLYPQVLDFLVEKGIYGLVVEKYEMHSIKELLHQTERRMILKRVS